MNKLVNLAVVAGCVTLVACSSSSSSDGSSGATDLQGKWGTPCQANQESNTSGRIEVVFAGTTQTISEVEYGNSVACDGPLFRSVNNINSYFVSGSVTELADGDANHIDITFVRASITGSPAYLEALASMGTTLEMVLEANEGITFPDINNISAEEAGVTQLTEYSLYRIDTKANGVLELRTGATTGTLDSSTPELRPTRLSTARRFDQLP